MTVTWPITPNSTLDPTTRPVPFVVQRNVTAVSVRFGSRRVEERAYRDGVFLWPYLRSTRDGNTFTLVRDDGKRGWPADPKPFVDEEPEPPTGGLPWGTIYTLDFAAQPSQVLGAPGSYTIDGLTWWRKNALKSGNVMQIVNGSGLQIADPASMLGGVDAPRLCLPVANVPGFNALAPYQVWAHWTSNVSGREFTFGLIDAPSSSAAITNAHDASYIAAGPSTPGGTTSSDWFLSRNGVNANFNGPNTAPNFANAEVGVFVATSTFDCVLLSADYAGTLPSADPFAYGVWHTYARAPRANAMMIFTPLWRTDVVVKKLSVIQPKVAA